MPLPETTVPIARRSAREAVFDQLLVWLEDGVLEPGEALKDTEIAELLGVSRTPVREALQRLERLGAVEMLPGRLTRVTPLAQQDIALLYAPLGALHGTAARLATPKATPADVAAMREHNAALLAALEQQDQTAARDADRAFHDALLALADNRYLMTAIEPLLIHARRLEALYFRETELGRISYDEHEHIVQAVEAGNADAAETQTRKNFERYWLPPALVNGR